MPIYSFKCKNCGAVFDFLVMKPSDKPSCSKCGSDNLEKQITAPSAVIMGGSTPKGTTCCGRTERCDIPPCSDNGSCKRD